MLKKIKSTIYETWLLIFQPKFVFIDRKIFTPCGLIIYYKRTKTNSTQKKLNILTIRPLLVYLDNFTRKEDIVKYFKCRKLNFIWNSFVVSLPIPLLFRKKINTMTLNSKQCCEIQNIITSKVALCIFSALAFMFINNPSLTI